MGFNEKETEAILDSNESLRFTEFELIRRRIHILQSAGIIGSSLSRLVSKRPDVLTSHEINSFLRFVVTDFRSEFRGKIGELQIERLLSAADFRFLPEFEAKIRLLLKFGIPKETLADFLNSINLTKSLGLKSMEETQRALDYLQPFGGSKLLLRRPAILDYDLKSQLIPRIDFLLQLSGNDVEATAKVLYRFPFCLSYTVDHVNGHVEFLHSNAGLSHDEIFKILLVYPSLLSASRTRKLKPRIEFLKLCGLNSHDIFKFLLRAPLFLSLSFEDNLANKLVLLVKLGHTNRTKELAMAMGAVTRCSCKNFQEVIGLFLNYGLSCRDIFEMSRRHPQVLQYNPDSLEEKLDYLVGEMGREVREVVLFPAYLGYNLDDRIKHRFEEKRKAVTEGMSINKLLTVSAATFSTGKEDRR
ncbi:hypothetical protein M569_14407 [Genlisea aurea]|uniref:Uncharacterized protein n=1 Tax=Genlisea aurea TaxID=192259 RepID=S8C0T5_9LAMI|nr:hypothetical protein M569_14407 [Genlisea aurea]